MSHSTIHPKLAHLTSEQIDTLIKAYYAKTKVSDLIHLFNIDCARHQLYKLFPPEISSELCPNCGSVMVLPRISQGGYRNEYKNGLRCSLCQHRKTRACSCAYCSKTRKQQKKKPSIRPQAPSRNGHHSLKAADLSLEQAVSLLSLMQCYGPAKIKNSMRFRLSNFSKMPFAPSGGYGEDLLSRLIEAGLVKISGQANTKFIALSKNKMAITFNAQWSLPDTFSSELIHDIEARVVECDWPTPWYEQVSDLALDIALAECREFYDYCAAKRMFPEANEHSITAMLRNLLEDFSTEQCFRIIQSCAQYASDFMVKQTATPRQAADYMIGACQRWADKARANNWVVPAFRRNFHCPRSMVNYMLYNFILKTHDDGLGTPIALIQLPAQK